MENCQSRLIKLVNDLNESLGIMNNNDYSRSRCALIGRVLAYKDIRFGFKSQTTHLLEKEI